MEIKELILTALRTVVIYVFVLIVMRVLGKRTVGNITAFDLVVAFIIGNVVPEPLYGEAPLVQALVIIVVVAGLHLLNATLGYHFPKFEKLTGGAPNVLIREGQMQRPAMEAERVNEDELQAMLREHNIEALDKVKLGTLETNGQLSVITYDELRVQRRDG